MILKGIINQLVEKKLEGTDGFLVSLTVDADNSIVVEIDSDSSVDLNFCAELSRFVEENLDREKEDFSLEVGSYGISRPFVLPRQYSKNVGKDIEILTKDGKKIRGVLNGVYHEYFSLETEKMMKEEGKKRKVKVNETVNFGYDDVKYTKLYF
ncbi:MAG: ribosome assembly cofactor RimP [Prevotellaceae bacterium]|jgi:ribosome maturation factor RimP|nr:ribosome assembly cofactor RimP [Prevotellaceae bacterium]